MSSCIRLTTKNNNDFNTAENEVTVNTRVDRNKKKKQICVEKNVGTIKNVFKNTVFLKLYSFTLNVKMV